MSTNAADAHGKPRVSHNNALYTRLLPLLWHRPRTPSEVRSTSPIRSTYTCTVVGNHSPRLLVALRVAAVTIGGVLGHGMCTGLAVVGGRLLATKISERTVAIAGGALFIVFAVHSLWTGPGL